MSRAPVPVGTRVKRSNGRWQVKVAPGEWRWEPRPSRKRKGRVVGFEVSHEDWHRLELAAECFGDIAVATFARTFLFDHLAEWEGAMSWDAGPPNAHADEDSR